MTLPELTDAFTAYFEEEPEIVAVAPGRVNLIGEHTDYNDGFVFPVAIDRFIAVAARRRGESTNLTSAQVGEGSGFDAYTVAPGQGDGWTSYPAGMAWVLREESGKIIPNLEGYLNSTVPMASGVSSSAALELAFGVLWNRLVGLGYNNKKLALLGQKCENRFVGVNCGIMDQMASAMGKAGHAMFLDTRSLEISYAPIPDNLLIVLCDTKKPRALTDSAYNERRSQCEEASRIMGVKALRDATMAMLDAKKGEMSDVVYRRAKHVITENDRTVAFVTALHEGNAQQIGQLMRASHESLRDDFEVSCRELDAMAEAAWGAPGCVGARMTGAGFGGACVALVDRVRFEDFQKTVTERYRKETGLDGALMACRPVEGARAFTASEFATVML